MNQTPSHAFFGSSRLIRFLSGLAVSNVELSHKHFVERLGQLIDFSDSIILASAHRGLPSMPFEPNTYSVEEIKDEFLCVRSAMVQSIIKSTTPNAKPSGRKLPNPRNGDPVEMVTMYEGYRHFYVQHQRDMDTKIHNLRLQIRKEISGVSPKLAQLSALDTVLGDTLLMNTRKFFAGIPRLLAKRFEYLLQEHKDELGGDPDLWTAPGGWLEKFYKEIQGLLLAELEVRLQPVLGLIEAFMKEVETNR
jgi:hypothetical protein